MIVPVLPARWYQVPVMKAYAQGFKRILYTWPRRHGKDVVMFQILQMEALKRVGNYWYLFPTRAWAERAIWNNTQEIVVNGQKRAGKLIDTLLPDGMKIVKHEKDLKITYPNGSVMQFSGTDSLDFVGQGGAAFGLSEYSLHRNEVTSYISPILEESHGLLIQQGTLRGKDNHLYKNLAANFKNPDCFTQWLTPEITKQYYWVGRKMNVNPELQGKINPETGRPYTNIQSLVDAGETSYALARQEFLNEAILESDRGYFSNEYETAKEERRVNAEYVKYDRKTPVFTFWDLGKGTASKSTDAMVCWFVQFPNEDFPSPKKAYLIDYHESRGNDWAFYANMLNSKGYWYGGHYAPWDIAKGMAGLEKTNQQYARERGIEFIPVSRTPKVTDDIESARRYWIDCHFAPAVSSAVDLLASYHEKTNRDGLGIGTPEHDNSSNAVAGFRTLTRAVEIGLIRNNQGMKFDDYKPEDFSMEGFYN